MLRKYCLVFFASATLLCMLLVFYLEREDMSSISTIKPSPVIEPLTVIQTEYSDQCVLKYRDPWNPEILPFLDNNPASPLQDCHPEVVEVTIFLPPNAANKSELSIRPDFLTKIDDCKYRCLNPDGDHRIIFGSWIKLETHELAEPKCDTFEVECVMKDNQTAYHNLYYQIFKPHSEKQEDATSSMVQEKEGNISIKPVPSIFTTIPDKLIDKDQVANRFGVHILIIDSTSQTQFFSIYAKNCSFVERRVWSDSFYYLNKVALNSHNNAHALFMGKHAEHVLSSPLNEKPIMADEGWTDSATVCHRYKDNDTSFIGFQFREAGYKTMIAEDWDSTVFTYPNCAGFNYTPADHYMRPFQLRLEDDIEGAGDYIFRHFNKDRCMESYSHLLEYFRQYVEIYDNVPDKFSITWIVSLAHDDTNALYHTDERFYKLFLGLKQKLDNSFLFIMGDHGLRFGKIRNTKAGKTEDNNPALFVALPRSLRSNVELKGLIETNSRQLITHHDLYATFLAIAKSSHRWNNKDWEKEWPGKEEKDMNLPPHHGSSLFHTLKQPRTCPSLRIPFEYCQCEMNLIEVTPSNKSNSRNISEMPMQLFKYLVETAVSRMNEDLVKGNLTSKCSLLAPSSQNKVQLQRYQVNYQSEIEYTTFYMTFETIPGDARFSATFKMKLLDSKSINEQLKMVEESLVFISNPFPRLNSHKKQSKCAKNSPILMPYCYCKNILTK